MASPRRALAWALPLLLLLPATAQDPAPPQDQVTLANGDRVTGTVKTMADGKLVIASPLLGDVTVKMEDVTGLVTGTPIRLQTRSGELLERQVTGLEGGVLQLAAAAGGPPVAGVAVQDLAAINPPPKPPDQWTGSVSLAFGLVTGNTERRSVSAQADAQRRTDIDRLSAKAQWSYAEQKNTPGDWSLTERRLEGGLKYDYFLSKKSYLLANTSAVGDTKANIQLRYTVGAGYGYQWVEEPDFSLATEAGINYFSESYRTAVPDNDTVAARLAYHLKWVVTEGVDFLQDVEYFPSLENKSDLYLTKDSRLRVSLTEKMFAQAQWQLEYDNTPSPGRERIDHRFLVSLGWSF